MTVTTIPQKPDDLTDTEERLWSDALTALCPSSFREWVSDFLFLRGAEWSGKIEPKRTDDSN